MTDTHDQSASRISGRTRAAVSAMCVRALRITVLKSAGNFTRDECHDLNAEKIQRVKCFMFTRCGFGACQQFSNAAAAGSVLKFQRAVNSLCARRQFCRELLALRTGSAE